MAHYAKISEDNEVLAVIVVADSDGEVESEGKTFCQNTFNWPANLWIKCSRNTFEGKHRHPDTLEESADQSKAFRGNYPKIGDTWDATNNIFIGPKPYASWVKNVSKARWESPLGDPPALTTEQASQNENGQYVWDYKWDEDAYQADNTTGWILVDVINQ